MEVNLVVLASKLKLPNFLVLVFLRRRLWAPIRNTGHLWGHISCP
jgi:hypothetical protein